PTWRAELDWAVAAGFSGVRLAPGFHGGPGASWVADYLDVAAACADRAVTCQLLVRLDDPRVRHPRSQVTDLDVRDIAEFIRAAPRLPLVASGLNAYE